MALIYNQVAIKFVRFGVRKPMEFYEYEGCFYWPY